MEDGLAELGALALGNRLKRLADCLLHQGSRIYHIAGVGLEPRWFPAYSYLYRRGPTTITSLAKGLGVSHAAINKIGNELIEARLVAPYRDRNDKRKRVLALTTRGRDKYQEVEPIWREIRQALQEMVDNSGSDILQSIGALEACLAERDFVDRFVDRWHVGDNAEILIQGYRPAYSSAFRTLNESWINQYFELQVADRQLLEDPQSRIIDQAGDILFAIDAASDEVLGTLALLRRDDDVIELAYMVVAAKARGRQVGLSLGEMAITRSREMGAVAICLFTSRLLNPSINIYSRLGFEERPFVGGINDSRNEVYMEFEL